MNEMEEEMKKLLLFGFCFALLSIFTAVNVDARPPCGKVWVKAHRDRHGHWVRGHWKKLRWVPAHRDRYGVWVPGRCR